MHMLDAWEAHYHKGVVYLHFKKFVVLVAPLWLMFRIYVANGQPRPPRSLGISLDTAVVRALRLDPRELVSR